MHDVHLRPGAARKYTFFVFVRASSEGNSIHRIVESECNVGMECGFSVLPSPERKPVSVRCYGHGTLFGSTYAHGPNICLFALDRVLHTANHRELRIVCSVHQTVGIPHAPLRVILVACLFHQLLYERNVPMTATAAAWTRLFG